MGQTELIVVVLAAGVYMSALVKTNKITKNAETVAAWSAGGYLYIGLASDLRLQAATPSNHL